MFERGAPVDPLQPPRWLRWALTAFAVLIMAFLLVMPLAMVLGAAFQEGVKVWFAALTEPDARSALELTLITAAVVIPLNAFFGMATAWAVTRFEFRGKRILLALIDLPFAVSPVVAGLCLVLLFGRDGWFAPFLDRFGLQVLFARPAIILATMFITFPFVARELIPLMEQQGSEEELAAPFARRRRTGRCSGASPCRTSNGRCCTACCCAVRARWASSARCRWCRATSVA